MASVILKGREIPLLYTVFEMKAVQEEIGPLSKAVKMIMGNNPDDIDDVSFAGSARHIDAIAKMVKILGNAGLEEAGEAPELTEKKIMRSMRPNDFASAVNACVNAMNEGMVSEIPAEKPEGPVDVTLEEMNKKKETES